MTPPPIGRAANVAATRFGLGGAVPDRLLAARRSADADAGGKRGRRGRRSGGRRVRPAFR